MVEFLMTVDKPNLKNYNVIFIPLANVVIHSKLTF